MRDRAASHTTPVQPAPVARGRPIVGHLIDLKQKGFFKVLFDEWRKNGDCFRMKLGPQWATVVAHPDGIERVLASNARNYIKGRTYDPVRNVLGDGLVTSTGAQWRKQRTLMQPTFHRASLAALVEIMAERIERFLDKLPDDGSVDAHHEMTLLTLDIVISSLFGGLLETSDVSYNAVVSALEIVNERSNGFGLPLSIPTPKNLRFKRVMRELNSTVYGLIRKARGLDVDDERLHGTLLGMLLDARDDAGAPLDDVEIRDELLTLFVAGHETTALTMTWFFTLVDDEVMGKLEAEVRDVLGARRAGFADVNALKYTRQVVDEVLRLRGPIAMVARDAVDDDNVLGVQVKAGDLVLPFFYGAHRHPDFWEEPERFWPERFDEAHSAGRDKWSYVPFSAGKRICIGNNFSLYETQLIIASLVQRFTFTLEDDQEIRPTMIATVRPDRPVRVRFRARPHG